MINNTGRFNYYCRGALVLLMWFSVLLTGASYADLHDHCLLDGMIAGLRQGEVLQQLTDPIQNEVAVELCGDRALLLVPMRQIQGEVNSQGLTVQSLTTQDVFSITPVELKRVYPIDLLLSKTARYERRTPITSGVVSVLETHAILTRPELTEEFMVSEAGIRQDFVITDHGTHNQQDQSLLGLTLIVEGATVSGQGQQVDLMLSASGRKLVYGQLLVMDSTGRQLPAEMRVSDSGAASPQTITIVVDDTDAMYPIRIDPTITDDYWVSLGDLVGANGPINAIYRHGANLYVGGNFTVVGNVVANHIARWDGAAWHPLGMGMDAQVRALAVDQSGHVYAGGDFVKTGGTTVNRVAKWDGFVWQSLYGGVNGSVRALAVDQSGHVYAGGEFTQAGGVSAHRVAKWSGASWQSVGGGFSDVVHTLAISSEQTLYAGGNFGVSMWSGSTWTPKGTLWNNSVHVLKFDNEGELYAGGAFTAPTNRVAKLVVDAWEDLGIGIHGTVQALAFDSQNNLYAGGLFVDGGLYYAAKWDGNSWTSFGNGLNGGLFSLAVDANDTVYGGGFFTTTGAGTAYHIARRQVGDVYWSGLGTGTNKDVYALAIDLNGDLYAAGQFTIAGAKISAYIAKCLLSELPPTPTPTPVCPVEITVNHAQHLNGDAERNDFCWKVTAGSCVNDPMQCVLTPGCGNWANTQEGVVYPHWELLHDYPYPNWSKPNESRDGGKYVVGFVVDGEAVTQQTPWKIRYWLECYPDQDFAARFQYRMNTASSNSGGADNPERLRMRANTAFLDEDRNEIAGTRTIALSPVAGAAFWRTTPIFCGITPANAVTSILAIEMMGWHNNETNPHGFYQWLLDAVEIDVAGPPHAYLTELDGSSTPIQGGISPDSAITIYNTGVFLSGGIDARGNSMSDMPLNAQIKIMRDGDSKFWSGTAFQTDEIWLQCGVSHDAWSYSFEPPVLPDTIYQVTVKAVPAVEGIQRESLFPVKYYIRLVDEDIPTPTPTNTPTSTPTEKPLPGAVRNLSATTDLPDAIRVSWQHPTTGVPDFYRVQRGFTAAGPFLSIATVSGSQTRFVDRRVIPRTTFYYRVVGGNAPNFVGGLSNVVGGMALTQADPALEIIPLNPSISVLPGQGAEFVMNVVGKNGARGAVVLDLESAPEVQGLTVSLSSTTPYRLPYQGRMVVHTTSAIPAGRYEFVVRAESRETNEDIPSVTAAVELEVLEGVKSFGEAGLVLYPGRTNLRFGNATWLRGRLTSNANAGVVVNVTGSHESATSIYLETTTNERGEFKMLFEPLDVGVWMVQAGVGAESVETEPIDITVNERYSYISLAVAPEDALTVGNTVNVGGHIITHQGFSGHNIDGTTVSVYLQPPSGPPIPSAAIATVAGSSYTVPVTLPLEPGEVTLKAIWWGVPGFSLGAVSVDFRCEVMSARRSESYDPGLALVITGQGDEVRSDTALSAFSNHWYGTLRDRRYNEATRLKYLNEDEEQDVTHNGIPEDPSVVDAGSSLSEVETAIADAAAVVGGSKPFSLWVWGAENGSNLVLGNGDSLSSAALAGFLNDYIVPSGADVRLVVDGPDAGAYAQTLISGQPSWVALASVEAGQPLHISGGDISFAKYMSTNTMTGMSIQDAYLTSRAMVRVGAGGPLPAALPQIYPESFLTEDPQYFGLAHSDTDMLPPVVDDLTEPQILESGADFIVNARVIDDIAVATVRGSVFAPDGTETTFSMSYDGGIRRVLAGNGWYSGTVPGISGEGVYRVVIIGEDTSGNISEPAETYLSLGLSPTSAGPPELYE